MITTRTIISYLSVIALYLTTTIHFVWAADHVLLDATQIGQNNYRLKITGFLQPQLSFHMGQPLEGLQNQPYAQSNGQQILPNLTEGHTWGMKVARARLIMRGSLPKSAQKVNYMIGLEMGQNPYTRGQVLAVTELSSTFSYIPGVRLRVGRFKLPTMEEIVQPVESHQEFISYSQTLHTLLGESPIVNGSYQGAHFAFRDQGLQAFNTFKVGSSFSISYAAMLSMAQRPNPNASTQPDVTLRTSISWIRKGNITSMNRKDVSIGVWHMRGERQIKEDTIQRLREGAFIRVEQGMFWLLGEWVRGNNMTENPNMLVEKQTQLSKHSQAQGLVAQGGARFKINAKYGEIGIKTRFENLSHELGSKENLQIFQSWTAGVEWKPIERLRVQYEYQMRSMDMPHSNTEDSQISEQLDDRMMLQATLLF